MKQAKRSLTVAVLCLLTLSLHAKDYQVASFGIYSDGIALNTRSIQFAIDYININGGGRLIFHVGRYLAGSIYLKSNVTLQLEEGAVLLGSLNPFDYDKNTFTAFVFAIDQHDIKITGKGMIDGQGKEVARNFINIIDKGFLKDPLLYGRPEAGVRPMNVYMRGCSNVEIQNITLRNSASWNQTYDQCRHLTISHITVDNKAFWNEDGIDIVDCDSASVTNSYIDAADDAICLKSHSPNFFCSNILINNNVLRSSANAVKFGTASLGGFKNVRIINNKVFDTYRSAIALEAVDGGFVENIEIDSLQVYNSGNAVFLRVGERRGEKTSRMNNITIKNVYAEIAASKPDAGYQYEGPVEDMPRNISPAIIIAGLANKKISGVTVTNVEIKHPGGANPHFAKVALEALDSIPEIPDQYPDFSMFKELPAWAVYVRHATGLAFSNITLTADKKDYRLPIVLDDVHNSRFTQIKARQPLQQNVFYSNKSTEIIIDKGIKSVTSR
ncbi:MAG: glycosyl hydrolase family 28 protein [Bacteroidota bacterium]|nr:glycosyl hydrolase family 28 protein [Bacteroidota bacterium]